MSERPDVIPGDRVGVSATHKVYIDGMDAFVKVEANVQVQEGEEGKDAIKRVSKLIAQNIVLEIERQGEVIHEANEAQAARRKA